MNEDYSNITPSREECVYTSCYCEENVWKLCEFIQAEKPELLDEVHAVFISNDNRMVPLWKQKSGHGDQPVIWDYHVILLHTTRGQSWVYDLDTELPFPCPLAHYAKLAFRSDRDIKPTYHRKFRVNPASSFLSTFASDRSHMKDEEGEWRMPPPPYPCIRTADCTMNLDDFISMDSTVGSGQIFTLSNFIHHYTHT